MAATRPPELLHPSAFTLSPSHDGGRRALKGFQFQTEYIAYLLAGFAAGKEDFVSCRIEAVEDLDAFLRVGETWVERYWQIKTRREGAGNWTLNLLHREGVLARFFSLFRRFRSPNSTQSRTLELVLAVDGELGDDLVQLRDESSHARDSRGKLLILLWADEASSQNRGIPVTKLREWCGANVCFLPSQDDDSNPLTEQDDIIAALSASAGLEPAVLQRNLLRVGTEIATVLDDFIGALRFESRLGATLQEATRERLLESGDLSPEEAEMALERLKGAIRDESALPEATDIDQWALRKWPCRRARSCR
ncbi:MAG TPA: hypothetical protein VIY49_39290 [Bryobacteraceae bacterium]